MRRAQLIGWIVVGGLAASACSGASGTPRRDIRQLPEDRPIRLQGSLEMVYGPHVHGTRSFYVIANGKIEEAGAEERCVAGPWTARVESRVVEIRDDAGDLVASAVTGPRAVVSSSDLCSAETRFVAHLPRRHSYTFNVRELPGSAEPVSFDHLKASGFECPLTITVAMDLTQIPNLSCTPPVYELRMMGGSDPHW